ncbi:MAG: hypothetical protein JRH11_10195 [Deltaproteobacteria bacterium]|nr:hypothetical protein [Deltaproteobacteria bacterium]
MKASIPDSYAAIEGAAAATARALLANGLAPVLDRSAESILAEIVEALGPH